MFEIGYVERLNVASFSRQFHFTYSSAQFETNFYIFILLFLAHNVIYPFVRYSTKHHWNIQTTFLS